MRSTLIHSGQPPHITRKYPRFIDTLELLKPVTWFPPMWAFACGAISSGIAISENFLLVLGGVLLAGPLVCAMSQAVNDWFDRHVDAINEPNRPIPSGRIPGAWGLYIAIFWTVLSLAVSWAFGSWVFVATIVGSALAWAYSAPPFRLKLNGWYGNAAVGFCYEGLAWFTGAAVLLGTLPSWQIITIAVLYSLGAHGIMTLNDFKALEGDRLMDVRSLPVQLGPVGAAKVAALAMAVPQMGVVALLFWLGLTYSALAVFLMLLAQIGFMAKYLWGSKSIHNEPVKAAIYYNATGVTLFVAGMMVTAFGLASIAGGA